MDFVVLIGGVPPQEVTEFYNCSSVPSLHLAGDADALLPSSLSLHGKFFPENSTLLRHSEGHNIPSIRTQLYPQIKTWIYSQTSKECIDSA